MLKMYYRIFEENTKRKIVWNGSSFHMYRTAIRMVTEENKSLAILNDKTIMSIADVLCSREFMQIHFPPRIMVYFNLWILSRLSK